MPFPSIMTRRQIFSILGAGGLGLAGYRLFGGQGMAARGRWPRGPSPAVTPTQAHYRVSKNQLWPDPRVDLATWRLDVFGLVERRLALTLDNLRAMPADASYATLACIGNRVPALAISTALWKGVRLAQVLERAGVDRRARDVVFVCADNYTDSLPIERALDPDTILAYEMNGAALPRPHGYPLRAIVPGIYGMKNVKWIEGIELVDGDYRGYWQQRGWSDTAPYRTLSRIDEPRNGDTLAPGIEHAMSGIAFAGDRRIARVEVGISPRDATGAIVWQDASMQAELGPHAWRLWATTFTPPASGRYQMVVRATDATGQVQTRERHDSFPDGATGWHTIDFTVIE